MRCAVCVPISDPGRVRCEAAAEGAPQRPAFATVVPVPIPTNYHEVSTCQCCTKARLREYNQSNQQTQCMSRVCVRFLWHFHLTGAGTQAAKQHPFGQRACAWHMTARPWANVLAGGCESDRPTAGTSTATGRGGLVTVPQPTMYSVRYERYSLFSSAGSYKDKA